MLSPSSFDLRAMGDWRQRSLVRANVLVFVLQLLLQDDTTLALTKWFALWPVGHDIAVDLGNGNIAGVGFRPWQLITYGFMHGSVMHILLNMYALYMFGGLIERVMGQRRFIIYYFTCLIAASLAQLAIVYLRNIIINYNARYQVGGMRCIWRSVIVYHVIGITVVGKDNERVTIGNTRFNNIPAASVCSFCRFYNRAKNAGMTNHICIGKV